MEAVGDILAWLVETMMSDGQLSTPADGETDRMLIAAEAEGLVRCYDAAFGQRYYAVTTKAREAIRLRMSRTVESVASPVTSPRAASPELRLDVLAHALKLIAGLPMPAKATAIVDDVLGDLVLREENAAPETMAAIALLLRSGLVESPDLADDRSVTIGADTTLTASRSLIAYTWSEEAPVTPPKRD